MGTCSVTVRRIGPVVAGHGPERKEERLTGVPLQSLVVEPDCTLSYRGEGAVLKAWDPVLEDDVPSAHELTAIRAALDKEAKAPRPPRSPSSTHRVRSRGRCRLADLPRVIRDTWPAEAQ